VEVLQHQPRLLSGAALTSLTEQEERGLCCARAGKSNRRRRSGRVP
jgi:hypothetical protein